MMITNTSTSSSKGSSTSSASSPEHITVPGPLPPHIDPVYHKKVVDFINTMPIGVDTAELYAALKAEMGIRLSKDRAQSSTAQIPKAQTPPHYPKAQTPPHSPKAQTPPHSPKTQSPPHSPKVNPIFPLVEYSDDEEEEEEKDEAEPQPTVRITPTASPRQEEGIPAQNIPSPASGGGSTSVHGPTQIEVVEIDDDEEENIQPTPADVLLQEHLANWNLVQDLGAELLPDREEPLQHQGHHMTPDQLSEAAEALWNTPPRGEVKVEEHRSRVLQRLVDEVEEVEQRSRALQRLCDEEEEEAGEDILKRMELKRKGKEIAPPPSKKSHPPMKGIVIRDPERPVSPLPQDEEKGSGNEEQELRWPRAARKQRQRPTTATTADYSKRTVVLTPDLLKRMLHFDNAKCQKEVNQRVTAQKWLKVGKKLHLSSLETI